MMVKYGIQNLSTFTGKERDVETGYGYFGARYMDHELMTMWLSVDPMADKYPGISPYAYCAWNPIRLVDPDGREFMENEDWYKNGDGDILWDENVKGQDDLPDNFTYLGSVGVGVNEEGQVTRVYNEDGTIDEIPQTLTPVNITGRSKASEVAAQMPVALSYALYDGPELGPADAVAVLYFVGLAGYYTYLIVSDKISAINVGSSPIQEMSQHGVKNVKLSPAEEKRCNDILNNPQSTKKERAAAKQKLKANDKAKGIRKSRQSKDKKTK